MNVSGAFHAALGALENLPAIEALRTSVLAYPLVNALHVIGVALLFGAIVPLDLRLAGWRSEAVSVDRLAALLLPVAIFGFALAAFMGLLLFATDARAYAESPLFQAKLALIGLALINVAWLRRRGWRGADATARRVAAGGAASLVLWAGAIVLGRLVGYF